MAKSENIKSVKELLKNILRILEIHSFFFLNIMLLYTTLKIFNNDVFLVECFVLYLVVVILVQEVVKDAFVMIIK